MQAGVKEFTEGLQYEHVALNKLIVNLSGLGLVISLVCVEVSKFRRYRLGKLLLGNSKVAQKETLCPWLLPRCEKSQATFMLGWEECGGCNLAWKERR